MAKKQGLQPILGAADSTLVNSAYRAAISNKPVNMRQQFQNTANAHANMLNSISKNFKSVVEGEKLYNQEMKDTLDPLYAQFENGTLTDGLLESRLGQLDAFKEEWKNIPRGKAGEAARSKWKNKVNRYLSDQKGIIGTLVTAGTLNKNGELHDLSAKDAQTVTAVANLHGGKAGDGATAVEINNPDGTTSFKITPKQGDAYTVTSDELKNILPIKYHKSAEKFTSINTGVLKDGKTTGLEYGDDEKTAVSNDVVNFIEGQGENKAAAYRSATLHKDGGMTMSFKEALYNKDGLAPEILDGLISAGQIEDGNNDGKIDQKDVTMLTEENYNAMVDGILGDHRVGSKILGDWYASTEGQRQFDKGKKMRKTDKSKTTPGSKNQFGVMETKDSFDIFGSGQWTKPNMLNTFANNVNQRNNIPLSAGGEVRWNSSKNVYELFASKDGKLVKERDIKNKNDLFGTYFEKGADPNVGVSSTFLNSEFYKSITDFGSSKTKKVNFPKDQGGNDVPLGFFGNTFTKDDNIAIDEIKAKLPAGFTVTRGATSVGKFFGVDKVRVVNAAENIDFVYDVGYDGDPDKAESEANRFNSELGEYLQ